MALIIAWSLTGVTADGLFFVKPARESGATGELNASTWREGDRILRPGDAQLIRSLQARIGVTSVVVTHDLHSAWKVGDRLALLHEGRVQFTGTPAEATASRDLLVQQFIQGMSEGPVRVV